MNRKGFTLIGAVIGLSLLGIVTVTVLPIVNSSFGRFASMEAKAEMIFIGESVIEKIKAYQDNEASDFYLYDTSLSDLINQFKESEDVESLLPVDNEYKAYEVKIIKGERTSRLWEISVYVRERGEGRYNKEINYKTLVPAK